jgi:GNAT superfamily N-acetyltransferase
MQLLDGYTDIPPGKIANVHTCLEMLEPPASRTVEEAAWVLEPKEHPEVEWYRALFRRIGGPYLWFSRLQCTDERLAETIRDPSVHIYSVVYDGADEGLLELDFRAKDECEIAFFGLSEKLQGKGAGRWMMDRAIAMAWSHPIRRLSIHTCSSDHPAALRLYMRSGFRPYKRQIEIADDPRLTGLLDRTQAPQIPLV